MNVVDPAALPPARAGETVLMPVGVPHAVRAAERFKMVLSMVRG
jgi:quercetin dioxygenase-like cupin family protein